MFSTWTRQIFRLSRLLLVGAALTVLVPFVSAYPQNGPSEITDSRCTTWEALKGKCAKDKPNTDDVLDHPNLYVGRVATLEGRVDHIYSPTMFAMQDNYDLIPHGDRLLMISVMPVGARPTRITASGPSDANAPVPAVEMVQLLQNGFKEGKIIRARGTIRMFDRVGLEQEFGRIDFGSTPLDKFENKPVLLLGVHEFAEFQQQKVVQEAALLPPQPLPDPSEAEPAPPPEVVEPHPQLETVQSAPVPAQQVESQPEIETPTTLPETATPMPVVGLGGLFALLMGIGIRFFRT